MKRAVGFIALMALVSLGTVFAGGANQASNGGPVTISIGNPYGDDDKYPDKIWYQQMLKDLNVNINWIPLTSETFNLMLASGDMPDIVFQQNREALANVVQSGLALDLEPYQKQYLPSTLLPTYAPTVEFVKAFAGGPDHKFYILSNAVGAGSSGGTAARGYVVRWDYYKETGAPAINNDDDYIAVLKQMQANHPTSISGKKTYGVGVRRDLRYIGGYRAAFTSALAHTPWVFNTARYEASIVTNTLYDYWTDLENSAFYADMRFYNKLNREGLFDPDTFTMSTNDYLAKAADGAYMALYWVDNSALYPLEVQKDPQSLAYYMAPPVTGAVSEGNKMFPFGNNLSSYAFVSRNSKNKEKAMEVLNWLWTPENCRIIHMGQKGVHWDIDASGKGYITDLALNLMANNSTEWNKITGAGIGSGYGGDVTLPDGNYVSFRTAPEYAAQTLSYPERDIAKYYGLSYPGEGQLKLVNEGKIVDFRNDISQLIGGMVEPTIPTEIARILTACNEITNRAMPLLIGAATDAEFTRIQQQLIADVKAAGEQTAWEWAKKEFDSYKTIIDPYFQRAQAALLKK